MAADGFRRGLIHISAIYQRFGRTAGVLVPSTAKSRERELCFLKPRRSNCSTERGFSRLSTQNYELLFIANFHAALCLRIVRIMDACGRAWHSRAMQKFPSMRRLCLALLLSHALAIQTLVIAWSGAQAAVLDAGAFTQICKGIQSGDRTGDPAPNPQQGLHHDCLSACTGGLSALEPQQPDVVLIWRSPSRLNDVARETGSRVAFTTQVFSARAPPKSV